MSKPEYLNKYKFDWEMLDVVIGGKSALDAHHFFGAGFDSERIGLFLKGYGISGKDPISKAELFGNFQESIQFIKRYFLKDGNKDDGLDLKIPNSILMITDVGELFQKIIDKEGDELEGYWAELVLKVMHTILHIDKDLRGKYFSTIQTQILDNYYRFISRDAENNLLMGKGDNQIKLIEFDTKTKKTRDSVILKLLHKAEHVAEELFDRVGIRFVTTSKLDCIRVIEFLIENGVVIPHNIKPSRSVNTLIDLESLRKCFHSSTKTSLKNNLSETDFFQLMEDGIVNGGENNKQRNDHSLDSYRSIQITARQLIRYEDPFLSEFLNLKRYISESDVVDDVKKRLNGLDLSSLTRDVEFFYPYEIQVVDEATYENNKKGDASHTEYKRVQLISARDRLFNKIVSVE